MAYQPPFSGKRISLKADSNTPIEKGVVTLASGDGITLDQNGNTITVDSSAAPAVVIEDGEPIPEGTQPNTIVVRTGNSGARGVEEPTIVTFTSSGTFTKADYPGIVAVEVEVQGAGSGGGGAAATSAGESAAGTGGSSGAYARGIIPADDLTTSVTVTVGAGSAGGSGTGNSSTGGSSSFGNYVVAGGGVGSGGGLTASSTPAVSSTATSTASFSGTHVTFGVPGRAGTGACRVAATSVLGGRGADSPLGSGGPQTSGATGNGLDGEGYGSGGSGGRNGANSSARTGGKGADGIVIVKIYRTAS